MHFFDEAMALRPLDDGSLEGATSPAYWNMVGPYGGITAAVLLQAVWQHPQRLGEPLSITINYAVAVAEGRFRIRATPVQTNRSTQHWIVVQESTNAQGDTVVATTATVITAVRRNTWSASGSAVAPVAAAPQPPQTQPVMAALFADMQWRRQYETILLEGHLPLHWEGQESAEDRSLLWVRDVPPRPLDFPALLAMCDVFFPSILLRRATLAAFGTVTLTVYFHADATQLAAVGSDYLLGQSQGREYRNNYADDEARLWSRDGVLLATASQMLYYKQ